MPDRNGSTAMESDALRVQPGQEPEWDEVFDAAAAAYCKSTASREALRLCFQSKNAPDKISIGWTASELMDFAKGIAALYARAPIPDEGVLGDDCRARGAPLREDFAADAHRLAMELECLLLSTKDTAAQSRWWDSAHEALEQHRQLVRDTWAGSPEAAQRRQGASDLAQQLDAARRQRDELLEALRTIISIDSSSALTVAEADAIDAQTRDAITKAEMQLLVERGAVAWADAPSATEWVEEKRSNREGDRHG